MDKLAVGPLVNPHRVSLSYPVAQNLASVAEALSKPVSEVTVCILDRPRHAELIRQVRATGARIRLISDGDVAGAIETARPGSPVDVMMGVGGTPEGVVAAAALKCLGGSIQGRLAPREEFGEREKALELGYDLSRILFTDDLCGGDDVFFAATGVSDGDLLRGVRFEGGGRGRTQSMVMRAASGTVRTIETEHRWGQARAGKREVRRKRRTRREKRKEKRSVLKKERKRSEPKTHTSFFLSLLFFNQNRRSRPRRRRAWTRKTTRAARGGSRDSSRARARSELTKRRKRKSNDFYSPHSYPHSSPSPRKSVTILF